MKKVKVSLNSIEKVKRFVNDINRFDFDFDLVSGRYVIDAKSIMGIFSLDLSQPIELDIHSPVSAGELFASGKTAGAGGLRSASGPPPSACPAPPEDHGFTVKISVVSIALSTRSSILPRSFASDRSITSGTGFVTGCFATKIVQQSSYGRIDVA